MSLKKTFALWVVALMLFSWILLALTLLDIYYVYEDEIEHHEDIQQDLWTPRNVDLHIDVAIQLVGIISDILLLIGILWEFKTLVITWLVIVPFRIVAHIAGTVFVLSVGRGATLSKALSGLRIVLSAMLVYSLYVGSRYFIQVQRRMFIHVDKIPEARMTVLLGGGHGDSVGGGRVGSRSGWGDMSGWDETSRSPTGRGANAEPVSPTDGDPPLSRGSPTVARSPPSRGSPSSRTPPKKPYARQGSKSR